MSYAIPSSQSTTAYVPVKGVRPAAPLFSNLGKAPKDLLSKGFPSSHKVEVTTTAEKGVSFVSTVEKKQGKTDHVVGTFQPKYKLSARGLELAATIDTDNQIKAELSLEDLFVPGVKSVVKSQTGANHDSEVSFEYKHEMGTFNSALVYNPVSAKGLVSTSATVYRNSFTVGFESKYAIAPAQPGSLSSVVGAVNYKATTHDLTAFVYAPPPPPIRRGSFVLRPSRVFLCDCLANNSKSDAGTATDGGAAPRLLSAGAHLYYTPSTDLSFASSLDFDVQKNAIKVTLGGSRKVDPNTEVKAKISTDGRLGLGFAKQVYPSVKATLGTELNTFDLAGSTPKFGLHFEVKA